ncbi:serine hydrolase [Naasia sp. SYSU D00948]|uniref:serine hydrolase domain-containing protein n=1 Tax=Naasia sp. SYSU D00948 TaxID=2817379 RepID=UPI001B31740C|nr:serine hydrolase [Naasia sp. SYSU D00948]
MPGSVKPPPPRRLLRRAAAVGGALLVILLCLWLAAYLSTPHSQLARTLVWLEADVDDWKRFPARTVERAGPVFDFTAPTAEQARAFDRALSTTVTEKTGEPPGDFLERTSTTALLAIQSDVLVHEEYLGGYERESTQTSFSMAKSVVSALVGIAIAEGAIGGVDDPITEYVPELLDRDPRFAAITIRDLLTMSSGIAYTELGMPFSDDATTYYAPDLRDVAVSAKISEEPGRRFHYNNFHPLLLGLILERTTGECVACFLEDRLWSRLGMEADGSWSLDSEASGFEKMESGLNGRAIDFAKFGRLFLEGGNWNGEQLIPSEWVEESTRVDDESDPADFYQYLWWVTPREDRPHFYARGNFGQYIYVAPEKDLVLVRFGRDAGDADWPALLTAIADAVDAPG